MSLPSDPPLAANVPLPILRDRASGRAVPLRVVNSIGRDAGNDIRVDDVRASAQHAVLRWDGSAWILRDLASTNGTFVDGRPVKAGSEVRVELMSALAFGDPDRRWWLAADGAPQPFAESLVRSNLRVEAANDVLGLPSGRDPRVMIFRGFPHWTIEDDDGVRPVDDRAVVVVEGHPWRLSLPMPTDATQGLAVTTGKRLRVSGTLHRPGVVVASAEGEISAGRSNALRLLWLLVREFTRDGRNEPADRGLTHIDLVARELGIDPATVDVYVYRLRGRFAKYGVFDLIERRKGVGQLRLGFSKVEFQPTVRR